MRFLRARHSSELRPSRDGFWSTPGGGLGGGRSKPDSAVWRRLFGASARLCVAEGEEEEQQQEEGESRCDAWRLRGDAAPDSGAAEAVPAERRPGPLMRSSVGRQRPEGCITSARFIGACAC